ncbi:MAG: DNA primase, partial [Spirochaetia bacterium]|nr:DNA primase [Spirochaetia bacterium]
TDTSESFGITFNADMMFALISTEELEKTNQLLVKQLKNRYSDKSVYRKFLIGIDRPKMRLYDCEQSAQEGLLDKPDDLSYDNEEENNFKSKIRGFVFNE